MHLLARLLFAVAAICLLLMSSGMAAGSSGGSISTTQTGSSGFGEQYPWTDSLTSMTGAAAEHPLQYYLDSLGYNIDVANDELGLEVFCAMDGLNTATMVIEVAGSAVWATSGYYAAGDTSTFYQLFGPSDGPGDSVQFSFSGPSYVGFYMKPSLPSDSSTWLTETSLNHDAFDHAWVFSTGVQHEYLICFEDLPDGGDEDYQDLVIRVTFSNAPPEITLPGVDGEIYVTLCAPEEICFDLQATDSNCDGDSIWIEMLSGEGSFTPIAGVSPLDFSHCFTPTTDGDYVFVFEASDASGEATTATVTVHAVVGTAPSVSLNDSSFTLCEPTEICLPVEIIDPDCDITSITTNYGTYAGTVSNYDQVSRINTLGGTVTQIGGGSPGTVLLSAADYVPPVNSQSGVAVTLPNFVFVDHVDSYGSFPNGTEPGNSADHLLGPPTDLTFTTPGAGGPDGGAGDGSVAFTNGNRVRLGFAGDITTCHGANSDFIIFTNTAGSGTARIWFRDGGSTQLQMDFVLPSGASSSGMGGYSLDLPDGITFDNIKVKCISGSLEIDAFAARTSPSSTTSDVCFYADTSGNYQIIVTATDSCGAVGADTAYVTVGINEAPVADAGADLNLFACDFEEICLPVMFSDPDGNLLSGELVSGPGTFAALQICFTPTMAGVNTFVIKATDSCGLVDYDTVVVTVSDNDPPIADEVSPANLFLCDPVELCHQFNANDPNGGPLTWTHLAGVGSITPAGYFCFTPTITGTYGATVIVSDSCGLADTVSIGYDLTINSAPEFASVTTPVDVFQCTAEEICYQFTASDVDGGTLTYTKLSGDGTLSGSGEWCFTPSGSGSYAATVTVTDSCGLADTVSLTYNVALNEPPTVAFGADTALQLCDPQEICLEYTPGDPQGLGGLVEEMVSGYGAIDTSLNQICFTPTTAGSYDFVVKVTDPCNEMAFDTVNVLVAFGEVAQITCLEGPVDVALCAADEVCQALTITPTTAVVTTSFGTYSGGQLCFQADTTGTYVITVIADEDCGSDTCQVVFNVDIGQAAQIDCPAASQQFICEPGDVCIPVGVFGTGAVVTVSPIGTHTSGTLCFPADTSGHYEITVIASTTCGTDTCVVVTDVTVNSAPVAVDPPSPVDTFLCAPGQICFQFDASDVDNNLDEWRRLSGDGTVSTTGLWCFDATGNGSKTVTVEIIDDCGAADTTTLTYNITVNSAPVVTLPGDETRFLCAPGPVCVFYDVTDTEGNVVSIEETTGIGTVNETLEQVCFDPTGEGVYQMILKVTDACGAEDYDTVNVTVDYNQAPDVLAGADQTVFQCELAEICWPVSVSDVDGNLSSSEMITGPGTFDGSQICFTPTGTYNYEFVIKATDVCGLETYDTVAIYYTLNTAPVADAGADQSLFQCEPTEVCWPVTCSDVDGNLAGCALVAGPGVYNGSTICFTPGASGSYDFVMEASDACGAVHYDTVTINVTINSAPVCTVPSDTLIFLCTSTEVCLPAFATDVDGNLDFCQIISGPGTLSGGAWCYTPLDDQAVTVTMRCQDDCGAYCESTFNVEFDINDAPTIAFGNDTTIFLCGPTEICLPYTANDPDDLRPVTISHLSGAGTLDELNSEVCFTATVEGTYEIVIGIEDECGLSEVDTINVTIELNEAPSADAGADQTLFLCDNASEISWPAGCTDADGNLTDCLFNGPGSFDGDYVYFTPATSGDYVFSLQAIDECGETDIDSVTISITINSSPEITSAIDTSVFLCDPQEICFDYTVDDVDGLALLVEAMAAGYGAIDTLNNQICFTPSTGGTYEFILSVTDSCGASAFDTTVVTVTFGEYPTLTCQSATNYFLCGPDDITIPITVAPASATVAVSSGTYSGGEVTFSAAAEGPYSITVVATTACGVDTCVLSGNIDFNEAPTADAGEDQNLFLCEATEICWPASCADADGNLTACELISGPGAYNGSQICYTPSATGSSEFVLRATDACGEMAYDTVVIDVTLNSAPTITAQADSSVFLCEPTEICVSYSVSDPDGMAGLVESMISGFGTLDSATNTVCFTPTGDGQYTILVNVVDSCGVNAVDTVTVDVTFGEFAVIDCPTEDIDVFLCSVDQICQMINIAPAGATVSVSHGTYSNGELCFTADTSGTYIIDVIADASCGSDTCQVTFNVTIGEAAQIDCPPPLTIFLCEATDICIPVGIQGAGASVAVSPIGSYTSGSVCFPADTSGSYEIQVIASTTCGTDTCQIEVDVTINSAPIAVDPASPIDSFICNTDEICYAFSASDVDGGTLTYSRLSGDGTVTAGGTWCFGATASGSYSVEVVVTDSCGAADTTTLTYNVTVNSAPVVAMGNDTSLFICPGQEICLVYSATDVDGNLTSESLVLGTATIDTNADQICFTPGSAGVYTFAVLATDACGADDVDTIQVTVDIGETIDLACPNDTSFFLCEPDQVCRPVAVAPSGANVSVFPTGAYANGEVCFFADTAGHYVFTVVAATECDTATCNFAVDVVLNSIPIAVDPGAPVDTFICAPGEICCPFAANDADYDDLTWSRVSGSGTVSPTGEWCFTPTTISTYEVCAAVTDPCGAADTVCKVYNVTINSAPTIAFVRDKSVFACAGEELCLNYTTADIDNNIVEELQVSGAGTIDTAANTLCFTPDTSGVYEFVIKVIDACGEEGTSTTTVEIDLNLPPVVDLGQDRSFFLCEPGDSVCFPVSISDPNGTFHTLEAIIGEANYGNGQLCFLPDTAGVYEIAMLATDECDATDSDTVLVYIDLNTAPICDVPNDTSFFQCTPTQVSLPVTANDVDGNFDHCELLTGPGSIVGGNWVYTPTTDEQVTVTVMCLDECGASCEAAFTVDFVINKDPITSIGEDQVLFLCEADTTICWLTSTSDPDNNLLEVELLSQYGTLNAGQICFTVPDGERTYEFVLKATDSCGATDYDTAFVTVEFNSPPTLDLPPDFVAYLDSPGEACLSVGAADIDDNLSAIYSSPIGSYSAGTGKICFQADTSGVYCFEVTAVDDCLAETIDSVCIEIVIDECIHVQIQKTHDAIQGNIDSVSVFLNGSGKELGAYDFLIAYDVSALTVNNVVPGELIGDCGWEYFTFRHGADGQCGGCPTGLLRIVAIAETNNGANHPGCYLDGHIGSLADILFLVTNDRSFECMYAPVQFFWLDCSDNSFSSRIGDTLWISRHVYDFEHNPITNPTYGYPGYFGAHDDCLEGGGTGKPAPLRCVDFTNGGIDIICADSIDARGDLNLNEVPFEIADAVLYSNYFVHGLEAFRVNVDGQIAASDVNADGLTLTVADLVYLIRVVLGDAPAVPKLRPGEHVEAQFEVRGGLLTIAETDHKIGALSMLLEGEATPALTEAAAHMQLRYHFDGKNTRVLVFSMNPDGFVETGELLKLGGAEEVKEIEVGAYDGFVMKAQTTEIPDHFQLSQNYPNPFNPTTTFEFALSHATEWELVVFNVLGQKVTSWKGEDQAGWVRILWNADAYSSGVYFYKLEAGDFAATKKMVLLK